MGQLFWHFRNQMHQSIIQQIGMRRVPLRPAPVSINANPPPRNLTRNHKLMTPIGVPPLAGSQ